MTRPFVHPVLGEEAESVTGRYAFTRETRTVVDGRDVLVLVGYAVFDTSCCGAGGCGHALVPGFVVRWKHGAGKDGRAVSEVEPIADPAVRARIDSAVRAEFAVQQVAFLPEI
jgi:hypothetical protein